MRALLWVVLIAAAAWGGWWVIGSRTAESAARTWFEERRAEGWTADYEALSVQGFPNRFDVMLQEPALGDPGGLVEWSAERISLNALSYRPNHWIMVFPTRQRIETPLGAAGIVSADLRASVVAVPDPSLPLDRVALVGREVTLDVPGVSRSHMDGLRVAMERVEGAETRYRLGLSAEALRPGSWIKARVDPEDRLPEMLEVFEARAEVETDRPVTLRPGAVPPQPRRIEVETARMRWGGLELAASSAVDVDADGMPEGEVRVEAAGWREMLAMVTALAGPQVEVTGGLERALGLAAMLSGDPERIDLTLELRGGRVWIGPLPIAPAPRIVLR